ncbi:MAG TPA: hypothetical protein VMW72_01610 [Sedimentisphaerales bacterium]|nr:hypothetical protein [Sedimentisphaerales bacterium]
MRNKTYLWLSVVISLYALASVAEAQEEQWLRYRSAREARQILGNIGLQQVELSNDRPVGMELPQFNSESPLFGKLFTPMVESGHIWISLDRSNKNGLYDRLFIDSDGDGHLKDETIVAAYRTDQYRSDFGPVKVVFEVEDGPVTYHLNFEFSNYNDRNRLFATSGGWYEGAITVGGQRKNCLLIDQNANGTFNDKSLNSNECDRIRIGEKDTAKTSFVGNYIVVDAVLYQPEIARDGAYIKLTVAEDVVYGAVRLPETISEFAAKGENGLFTLTPEKKLARLPVGKYRVHSWKTERKDDKGNTWSLTGQEFGNKGLFEVNESDQTTLDIGEPIISTLTARESDSRYSFSQNMRGRLGERIELTRNGSQPRAPKLNIKNNDGSYDRTFSFEYG